MAHPRPVPPHKLAEIARLRAKYPQYKPKMWIQDPMFGSFQVVPGDIWPSHFDGQEGEMIILDASTYGITYERKGRAYSMTADDFQHNLRNFPVIEGARRARGAVRLAEVEIMLLMGVVSATGVGGLVLVVGTQTSKFIVENRENFAKWHRLARAFLIVRDKLETRAPILYGRLRAAFWNEVRANFWDSVTAEDVAYLLGQLVVSPGLGVLQKTFEAGWKTMAKAAATVLGRVAFNTGKVAVLKAVPYTMEELASTAGALIEGLQASRVPLDRTIAERIKMEVRANGQAVLEALEVVKQAVDAENASQENTSSAAGRR